MDSIYLFINNEEKEFRQFKDNPTYYVSADGDAYSTFSHKLLKHSIDHDGYHRIDVYLNHKQKHIKIHKLVYLVWVGPIPEGMQLNHIDDNKDNNHYTNLYLGTQKENIHDWFKNNHRVGNRITYLIRDNELNLDIQFPSIAEFRKFYNIKESCGINDTLRLNRLKMRLKVLRKDSVTTIEQYDQLKAHYYAFLKDHNLVEYT